MKNYYRWSVLALGVTATIFLMGANNNCGGGNKTPKSDSGVEKVSVKVRTNAVGQTMEQQNIINRYKLENAPGSLKHLYIISTFSGDVLIYSTVRGKVTSSGKRLTPMSVAHGSSGGKNGYRGILIKIGGKQYATTEVLQDDGTYGSSIPYLYWFDSKGVYHQHYVSGGQVIHISDQPLRVPKIIINMEQTTKIQSKTVSKAGKPQVKTVTK